MSHVQIMPPQPGYSRSSVKAPADQGLYDSRFEHDACGMGFLVHLKGIPSHALVKQALAALENLHHRGAVGSEPNTGDGAGVMMQIPHKFLCKVVTEAGISLPRPGDYGVGLVFLPPDEHKAVQCQQKLAAVVQDEGLKVLGWRAVPTNNSALGETARSGEPRMVHIFIGWGKSSGGQDHTLALERQLYVLRRRAEQELNQAGASCFYIASLSTRTLVYKGMLQARQLCGYFPDLSDPDMASAIVMIHSRFSTNTFPSWERAHPYRYVIHNGEINTLRGNVNWFRAREAMFASDLFGDDLQKTLPVLDMNGSDTAIFDNCLEFLHLAGRPLPLAVMMMIPEPWSKHQQMSDARRAFYEYHSCLMEPWDGPAAIGFTDGRVVGAVLDRNGLRPARYYVTSDDLVIMASEVGVLDIPAEKVIAKGRLQPGRMFLVDTAAGRIIGDEEIKEQYAAELPYRQWLQEHLVTMAELPRPVKRSRNGRYPGLSETFDIRQWQRAFGYTFEDLRLILGPMIERGVEPIGSMGDDTPLAVLSDKPQTLFNYFKQLFAQVTNPPIDSIREELITDTGTYLGAEGNLLQPRPDNCRRIKLPHPFLTNDELDQLRLRKAAAVVPILFPAGGDGAALANALQEMFQAFDAAIARGAHLLILSDREMSRTMAPIPALLATAGLHHHLIRQGTRTRVSIIVESGEPRDVHHFATLIGYGAEAINPYLAYATLGDILHRQFVTGRTYKAAQKQYIKASVKGVVKVMSKMGISTIQSYRGAQIFEALGLHRDVVETYFTGTPSRISGVGLDVLAAEVHIRHRGAFPERPANGHVLDPGGQYQWRHDGEYHLFNPATVHLLQRAVQSADYAAFQKYAAQVNDRSRQHCTLRGLLRLKPAPQPIPLDEVEPVSAIVRRFKTGAMSYGSISREAHEALALAMNRLGGKSNTGEGGEDPARHADQRNSAIKQVASGRFGVTSEYLVNAQEIQIKMAQGAKPGEGGQLPGQKVYPWIAQVRHSTPGVGLISPPPHHDIYSIEDLAQLIFDLKNANPRARINVKLVSEVGVGTVAAGVAKGHADVILISGHDGGTGASPQTSIKHAGLPWELGLAETHQTLLLNDLRSRVVLETDGQLKTGRDVVIAALLGAEEFGFATAPLVALGCIMMRVCQKDTCPVGIATQNPELRQRFTGDPKHVENFMRFIAQEVRELMAQLGFRTLAEMVGRTDRLAVQEAVHHWKASGLDLTPILHRPDVPPGTGRTFAIAQDHGLKDVLDTRVLLPICRPALDYAAQVEAHLPIRNTDRTVGTLLGSEVTRRYGAEGLPEDTIQLHFDGSAGQSFGAFLPPGITLSLTGDANDYCGKGLSGGKIIVTPPTGAAFKPEENVIIGNVAFYGATGGEAYIYGVAGERFGVRNSGLQAVVEAIGDHGCEYMTGGRVVILGSTGRNFAAGMSGGIAYVLDEAGTFPGRCNQEMVLLETLADPAESQQVKDLIWRHAGFTGSRRAWHILRNWVELERAFVKVIPRDYARMLAAIADAEAAGLNGEQAIMSAFVANKSDLSRVSGN